MDCCCFFINSLRLAYNGFQATILYSKYNDRGILYEYGVSLCETCKNHPPILVFCLLIYIISQLIPSFVGMRSNHLYYGFYLLWILYSVSGIVLINYIGSKFLNKTKILSILGKYSMEIYCLHWILIMFI